MNIVEIATEWIRFNHIVFSSSPLDESIEWFYTFADWLVCLLDYETKNITIQNKRVGLNMIATIGAKI